MILNNEEKIKVRFRNDIEKLRQTLIIANENYNIWWIYKSERTKYVDVLNQYLGFFSYSIHAHFIAMLLAISTVYELKDKKNLSLLTLINYARKYSLIEDDLLQSFENELFRMKDLSSKIQILRNNHFAHISKNLNYSQVLNLAKIRYDDFKVLIDSACKLLNDISYVFERSKLVSFGTGAVDDTHSLLNVLKDVKKID